MSTIDDAAEIIGRYVHSDFAEDAARALAAEGHLAAAPELAHTIAGMTEEWGVEYLGHVSQWGSRESAEDELGYYLRTGVFIPRLVRRLVGPVEAAE